MNASVPKQVQLRLLFDEAHFHTLSYKARLECERERETERQTDRQTDRDNKKYSGAFRIIKDNLPGYAFQNEQSIPEGH